MKPELGQVLFKIFIFFLIKELKNRKIQNHKQWQRVHNFQLVLTLLTKKEITSFYGKRKVWWRYFVLGHRSTQFLTCLITDKQVKKCKLLACVVFLILDLKIFCISCYKKNERLRHTLTLKKVTSSDYSFSIEWSYIFLRQ